ncbi:MAG: HSP20 family protein [Haloarculaceae archaeon]|jgi:HSP20 family protein
MIRDIGEAIGDSVVESIGRAVGKSQEQRPLPVDLLESDDAYLAVFDAPGVESGDVQVRFEDGDILVRTDRFREFHEGFEMRFPGRGLALEGRASLPADATVDASAADATLTELGTLQVRVPKRTDIDVEPSDGADSDGDESDAPADSEGDEDADE